MSSSGKTNAERWSRLAVFLALFALLALAGAACGGDDDEEAEQPTATATETGAAAGGAEEASQLVEEAEQPVSWEDPGPPIDVGTKVQGKTLHFIANGLEVPFVQEMLAGVKEAAALVGMKVVAVDGAGQSAKAGSLIEQAVSQGADVIVDEGFPVEQLTAPLKEAKAAGIPVIAFGAGDPGLPTAEEQELGVEALTTYCYSCAGKEMAQIAIADSNGKANALIYHVPGISVAELEKDSILEEFERLCPDCKTRVVEAPFAEWTTLLPSLTTSALRSDPELTYLMPLFDAAIPGIEPAVIQAGEQDRAKIISYNGSKPAMEALRDKDMVIGIVGGSSHWIGWAMIDQAVRLLTGAEPAEDENVFNRSFTKKNIVEIDLNEPSDKWYGVDFRSNYKKLWGLE